MYYYIWKLLTNSDMDGLEHKYFDSRTSFRKWLEANHSVSCGIWTIFHKKHIKIAGIAYREALEEALCFGWIDSIIEKVDEEKYIRNFTPRSNVSNWSDLNKKSYLH